MASESAPIHRLVVTGSSGVYGRALVRRIRGTWPAAHVTGIDRVAPPDAACSPHHHWRGDIRDPAVAAVIRDSHADTVVHLAYAVAPGRDDAAMREVNVAGTRRILAAAAAGGARRVLVASSATVYGPWPDNPPTCAETQPIRPRSEYAYARDKAAVEAVVAEFAALHPDIAVSVTRPAIICGSGVRNFLTDIFLTVPFMALPDGADTPLQFVHEDDVAAATLAILGRSARGPFNVAPAGAMTLREIARAMNIAAVRMPFLLLDAVSRLWWTLRLPWVATPPGLACYLRHPWVMTSQRLRQECGFSFSYSVEEAFRTILEPRAPADSHTA